MKTINCKSWNDAKVAIRDIRDKYEYANDVVSGCQRMWRNQILFRGQPNAEWQLQTTLDRYSSTEWTLWGYLDIVNTCLPQIESAFPRQWRAIDNEILDNYCHQQNLGFNALPLMPFLIYLRHHGFPSPLLDWSMSPWVAAHFAASESLRFKKMSIFVYCIFRLGEETVGSPNIHLIRNDCTTHPRHFLQQARYTFCTRYDKKEENQIIDDHENAISAIQSKKHQLFKITIPQEERLSILRELHEMNINDFSLFQDEQSLVKSMSVKSFDIEDYHPLIATLPSSSDPADRSI